MTVFIHSSDIPSPFYCLENVRIVMRRSILLGLLGIVTSLTGPPSATAAKAKASTSNTVASPTAPALMHSVVAQLPREKLTISGKLIVRRRRGVPVAGYRFELNSNWGGNPASATYRIDDNFGEPIEQLTILHGKEFNYHYMRGNPLHPADLSSLAHPIQKTDLTWADLSLAFLWWPGSKIVGEESIRTFECYIIELNAPDENQPYTTVKLWISKKNRIMLQAEGYDANHKLVRKLWIKSCKKIDGKWMIKDMEIQKYPAIHRTKLRVLAVTHEAPEQLDTPAQEKKMEASHSRPKP
jgi:hypothetical protein